MAFSTCFLLLFSSASSIALWDEIGSRDPASTLPHIQMLFLRFQRKDHWFCPSECHLLKKVVSCQLSLSSISSNTHSGSLSASMFDFYCIGSTSRTLCFGVYSLSLQVLSKVNSCFYPLLCQQLLRRSVKKISLASCPFKQKPQYLQKLKQNSK